MSSSTRELFKRFSRSLVGLALGRKLVAWILRHMSFILPTERLYETSTLVAFKHPVPAYPLHILLVPKKPLPGLMELDQTDQVLLSDIIACVQELVKRFELEEHGYRLIANGGAYQDFPYLHFHLIAESLPQLPII